MVNLHEKYIKRCIELAKNGLGTTYPNPMVGSVIVLNDIIIGEGWHKKAGEPHAEVNAINSVDDKSLLKSATIYVSLEPCSHFGKTPPCSHLIVEKEIKNVVIGIVDSNSKVSGKGVKYLKDNGCNVTVGVLESECFKLNKRFFTFHNKKRPYIILKWAETTDGYVAPKSKKEQKPVWITNTYSRQLVHKWRAEEHAILVGYNTVMEDNPSLTTRNWNGKNPIRVILDKTETLSKNLKVFDTKAQTLLIKETSAEGISNKLYKANINSIIIEGGLKTLQLFIDAGLWDEARVFTGNSYFNEGVKAPKIKGRLLNELTIKNDVLRIYKNEYNS